ncbi:MULTISPECIES: methyltransferase domain-containing protein [unclassified Synechococcus]|uniref:methyltransferase domain-containing protein n=1 Tax=unclassified Synechococcus TaxID=2626047 RepID=UPI001C245268|nr:MULTISPECIES: methyltransferase domain-containing protein [unclassified Synechococcus]
MRQRLRSFAKKALIKLIGPAATKGISETALLRPDNIYQKAIERRCKQIADEFIPPPKDIPTDAYRQWQQGLIDELKFWYLSVALDGWSWADSYKLRLGSRFDFQFPTYIAHFPEREIFCLEVGAGAMAALGTEGVPSKEITIEPTDALANAFAAIFRDFGVRSRFPVIQCDAESISDAYDPEHFHFAYASNCLDHCYNPVSAIQQMYALAKPTGTVLLGHHINVAVSENYTGLHQWNLCEMDGRFVAWNRDEKHFIDEKLPGSPEFQITTSTEQNWITVSIRKP